MGTDSAGSVVFATTTEAICAADYLSRIASGLREGRVELVVSGRTLSFHPSDVVRLHLVAGGRSADGTARLAVEISWRSAPVPAGARGPLGLSARPA